jgi:hypothetical protein
VAAALTAANYAQGSGPVLETAAAIVDFFNPLALGQDIVDIHAMLTDKSEAEPEE